MKLISIRASSFPELFDCPARWEAKYVRGMRLPRSSLAQLGTALHASTAAFDAAIVNGSPITVDDAAAAAVDAIFNPGEEVRWDDDLPPKKAERILQLNKVQ